MFDTFLVDIKMCIFQPKICGTRTIICRFGRCGGTRVATCENTPLICYPSTSRSACSNPRSVASAASLRSCYYSFKIIIVRGMGGGKRGYRIFGTKNTTRASSRALARSRTFLGRRAQNARYFVRLNGAVAPASRRAKTHVFACRHHKIFKFSGRRPQNALYFVRLNGAVAAASQCAKTHD